MTAFTDTAHAGSHRLGPGFFAFLVLLALLFPAPALAINPAPTDGYGSSGDVQDPVEQQSPDWQYPVNAYNLWQCTHDGTYEEYSAGGGVETADNCVHNPTRYDPIPCIWDVDDYTQAFGQRLTSTGPLKIYGCLIADDRDNYGGGNKVVEFLVVSKQAGLSVTLDNSKGGHWDASAVKSGRDGYRYLICATEMPGGPYGGWWAPPSLFPVIPNSNGGIGVEIDYTAQVVNPKGRFSGDVYWQAYGWFSTLDLGCWN